MPHYVVTFHATIDGEYVETGTIGSINATPDKDYKPNYVKRTVTEQMRINYPDAKSIAVIILKAEEVTPDEYIEISKNFIQLTTKP